MNIKLFDVILHPRLETSWVHFDLDAKDQDGKEYFERSRGYGGYPPPYPAFTHSAGENHFTNEYPYGYRLDPFDVNEMVHRLKSYEWEAGIRSIKYSNQLYVCPKTYIVWLSTKEKKEGTNYFEIKLLPSKRNDFVCCKDDDHKIWTIYKKNGIPKHLIRPKDCMCESDWKTCLPCWTDGFRTPYLHDERH